MPTAEKGGGGAYFQEGTVIEMSRDVKYPISYKSFELLVAASLMKPCVVVKECVEFLNYLAGWIFSHIPADDK